MHGAHGYQRPEGSVCARGCPHQHVGTHRVQPPLCCPYFHTLFLLSLWGWNGGISPPSSDTAWGWGFHLCPPTPGPPAHSILTPPFGQYHQHLFTPGAHCTHVAALPCMQQPRGAVWLLGCGPGSPHLGTGGAERQKRSIKAKFIHLLKQNSSYLHPGCARSGSQRSQLRKSPVYVPRNRPATLTTACNIPKCHPVPIPASPPPSPCSLLGLNNCSCPCPGPPARSGGGAELYKEREDLGVCSFFLTLLLFSAQCTFFFFFHEAPLFALRLLTHRERNAVHLDKLCR